MNYLLDHEEQELLTAFENNEFSEVKNLSEEKVKTKEILDTTLRKRKQVNLRIPEKDLYNIKKVALQKGMPYQTLILSSLHQIFSRKLPFEAV